MKRRITGRGVAVLCVSCLLLGVGLLLAEGASMTLGICGLLLVLACLGLAPRNLRDLELRVDMPTCFFAARRVGVVMELANRRRVLHARDIGITARFAHGVECRGHARWTAARSRSLVRERLSIPDRAVSPEVDYELHSRFPLGFFEVRQASRAPCPMLVYPRRILPREFQLGGALADPHPASGAGAGDGSGEPRGIRPYQPGDRAARIHPFASAHAMARGLGLQVRATDPPGLHPARCRILFHSLTRKGEVIRWDRFERALSLTAGTLALFQSNQTQATLQADFNDWADCPVASRAQFLQCLALLARARRAKDTKPRELAEMLQRVPAGERLVILSDTPPEHWQELLPAARRDAIVIDIRQVRFRRRAMNLHPAVTP